MRLSPGPILRGPGPKAFSKQSKKLRICLFDFLIFRLGPGFFEPSRPDAILNPDLQGSEVLSWFRTLPNFGPASLVRNDHKVPNLPVSHSVTPLSRPLYPLYHHPLNPPFLLLPTSGVNPSPRDRCAATFP